MYVFEAQRRATGVCAIGRGTRLAADCSNLAEVLHNLQPNHERFREYQDLIRRIFPDIQGVSVVIHAAAQNRVEVRVWLAPVRTQRVDDLTIALEECGTGIGQVLSILYVLKNPDAERAVIAIDEPNSFLHPEASRALIRILKEFPDHQYIIATHAPEVIAESRPEMLTVLEHPRRSHYRYSVPEAITGSDPCCASRGGCSAVRCLRLRSRPLGRGAKRRICLRYSPGRMEPRLLCDCGSTSS